MNNPIQRIVSFPELSILSEEGIEGLVSPRTCLGSGGSGGVDRPFLGIGFPKSSSKCIRVVLDIFKDNSPHH